MIETESQLVKVDILNPNPRSYFSIVFTFLGDIIVVSNFHLRKIIMGLGPS